MQFIEENNTLACSSNEGSIMQIQSHDDDDDRDNHCYYDSGNDEDNEINNNNNATSRLVNDLTNVDKFENEMMAGKWKNPNNDLLLSCVPSSSNSDSDNSSNGVSLAFMNYEFEIISESNNNNTDTTINDNVLNNFSNEDEIDTVWKPDSSSSNANQFHVSEVNTTTTDSNLRKLLFYTNTNYANEPNYQKRKSTKSWNNESNVDHTMPLLVAMSTFKGNNQIGVLNLLYSSDQHSHVARK